MSVRNVNLSFFSSLSLIKLVITRTSARIVVLVVVVHFFLWLLNYMTHTALDSSGSNCRRHSQGIKAVDAAAAAVVAAVVVVKAERVAVGCNKEERVFLCPSPGSL